MEGWPGCCGVRDHISWENVVGTGLFWFEEGHSCGCVHCQMLRAVMWGLVLFSCRNISPTLPTSVQAPWLLSYLSTAWIPVYLLHFFQKCKHFIYCILILHGKVLENREIDILVTSTSSIRNSWRFLKSAMLNYLSLHQWSVHIFGNTALGVNLGTDGMKFLGSQLWACSRKGPSVLWVQRDSTPFLLHGLQLTYLMPFHVGMRLDLFQRILGLLVILFPFILFTLM